MKSTVNILTLNKNRKLLLLAVPFILFVFAFNYVPLFGWIYAFFDYRPGIPLFNSRFEGFLHFKEVFSFGSNIGRVFTNTIAMNILNLLVSPFPVVFAILLNEIKSRKYRSLIQTATTIPNFISWIIVYSLCFAMFSNEGLLNQILESLGKDSVSSILGNRNATWYFQTALGIWKTIGWNSIIYLAAISGISQEMYDAAKVDGAGRFKSVLHITIPGLIPTFFVILLLNIGNMLTSNFDQYFVFYNSLVADKIEVIDYYAYRVGIIRNDYPLATAISMMKSLSSILLLFIANTLSKKVRGHGLF